MFPIGLAHYNVWAERFEAEFKTDYPQTFWMVLQHDELQERDPGRFGLPRDRGRSSRSASLR